MFGIVNRSVAACGRDRSYVGGECVLTAQESFNLRR
jgi:hypothetical protein